MEIAASLKGSVICDSWAGLPFTFEPERYMGNWYGIMHAKNQPFQSDAWTCSQASYTDLNAEDGTFRVYNSSEDRFYGIRFGVHGDAKYPADTIAEFGQGQMFVTFFDAPFFDTPNYQIIDTDYETYSVVYACHEDDMQYLWFLARTPEISDDLLNKMIETATEALPNFDWDNEIADKQNVDRCRYIQDVENPIVF